MRGIILSGGKGTRIAPFTLSTNKHLAPIYTYHQGAVPCIYYPINTLVNSGIHDILIITSTEHSGHIIETLKDGEKFNADFTYKIQVTDNPTKPLGIASALKLAQNYTNDDKFAVILGDNFFEDNFTAPINDFKNRTDISASVFIKQVPDPERFGVATINGLYEHNEFITASVKDIIEKPKEPKSNYAVTGLYLYTPDVYNQLPNLIVSNRNELEISHINDFYAKNNQLICYLLNGYWSDMGLSESMIKTTEFINSRKYKYNFEKNNAIL